MSAPAPGDTTPPSILTRPDGATIAYRQFAGKTPGVVFLCGFRSDMTGAKALFLEDYCRLHERAFVRFDYFGHGRSSGDSALGTIGRYRDDTIAIIDSLTQGPQVLVGSSMGGWIMLLAALARPDRIAGLVGIASAPDFTEEVLWPRLSPTQRRELEMAGSVTLPSLYDRRGYLYTRAAIEDGREHLLTRRDIPLDMPVRLLHGLKDDAVPWQTSLRLAERLASADVEVTLIKDGDHRLSTDADLAKLARALDGLLDTRRGAV
jgi:pimeloyl-ACP methyl ester carboxylesterase